VLRTPTDAPDIAINRTIINEVGTVIVTGKLVDPDGRDTLRLLVKGGRFDLSHRYAEPGKFEVLLQATDKDGPVNRFSRTVLTG
jgi:hypothetical protein